MSSPLISELLSFLRLSIADIAGTIEGTAGSVKKALRSTEDEVQDGQRNAFGIPKPELQGNEKTPEGTRGKFENMMDSAKAVGSSTIGAGQHVSSQASDLKNKTSERKSETFDRVSLHSFVAFFEATF